MKLQRPLNCSTGLASLQSQPGCQTSANGIVWYEMPQTAGKLGKMLGGWIDEIAKVDQNWHTRHGSCCQSWFPCLLQHLISVDEPRVSCEKPLAAHECTTAGQ